MPHEKTYVVCENMCMEESLTKVQIEECIEKNSGVPENGIIDFDGDTIPEGFEEIVNYSETIEVTEAGTDLNNYYETSKYWFKNANTPLNKPNDGGSGAGYLEVIKSDINNYVLQKWTRFNNGDCYIRVRVSGTWQAWKRVLNEDDLGDVKKSFTITSDYFNHSGNQNRNCYVQQGKKVTLFLTLTTKTTLTNKTAYNLNGTFPRAVDYYGSVCEFQGDYVIGSIFINTAGRVTITPFTGNVASGKEMNAQITYLTE